MLLKVWLFRILWWFILIGEIWRIVGCIMSRLWFCIVRWVIGWGSVRDLGIWVFCFVFRVGWWRVGRFS